MPANVRVDDLVIHPQERELVIGTHGRGIWVMDIAPLEQLTEAILKADVHLFDVKPVMLLRRAKRPAPPRPAPPGLRFPNPPEGLAVHFLTTARSVGRVELICTNAAGKRVGLYLGRDTPGLDGCVFDIVEPGEYTIARSSPAARRKRRRPR